MGGYTEEYNNGQFKFVTVRNAGHMVPYMQPARGKAVFKTFLEGGSMPRASQKNSRVSDLVRARADNRVESF